MRYLYFLFALSCLTIFFQKYLLAQNTYEIEWVKNYGGNNYDLLEDAVQNKINNTVLLIESNSDNGIYANNFGGKDIFILEINDEGEIVNNFNFGGLGDDYAHSIRQVCDGYLVCASTKSEGGEENAWVFLIDEKGEMKWEIKFKGEAIEYARNAIELFPGEYIVNVWSRSELLDFENNNEADGYFEWMIRFNDKGEVIWKKQIDDFPLVLLTDFIIIDGFIYGTGTALEPDADITSFAYTEWDATLFKMTLDGEILWSKNYGGSSYDFTEQMSSTREGHLFLMVHTDSHDGDVSLSYEGTDTWTLLVDKDGEIIKDTTLGGNVNDHMMHHMKNRDGTFTCVGFSSSPEITDMPFQFANLWMVDMDENLEVNSSNTIFLDTIEKQLRRHFVTKKDDQNYFYGVESFYDWERYTEVYLIRLRKNIERDTLPELIVYPNPSSHCLTFLVENGEYPFSIKLYDIAGKYFAEYEILSGRMTIDLGELPTGTYIYRPTNNFAPGLFIKE